MRKMKDRRAVMVMLSWKLRRVASLAEQLDGDKYES
jgi:hypothetical protein